MNDESLQNTGPHGDPTLEGTGAHDRPPRPRAALLRFAVAFLILVMALLTGYRYALNSDANIWYLFQVSHHTAWLLDKVGFRAEVEPYARVRGTDHLRAQLDAWRRGLLKPDPAAHEQFSRGPLTKWETWVYKAYQHIEATGSLEEQGPTIYFVARKGLVSRASDVRKELIELGAEDRDQRAALEEELAMLESQMASLTSDSSGSNKRRDTAFSFRVVSDCGAIPSMSIFVAAVLAFPVRWRKRLVGVTAGLVVLYGVNIVRLAMLAYLGAIDTTPDKRWFNFTHEYIWQGIFIVFVVGVWLLWIELSVQPRSQTDQSPA